MAALLTASAIRPCPAAGTLNRVRHIEHLACGVVSEPADWNKVDVHGDLSPLGERLCTAIADQLSPANPATRIVRFPSEAEALGALADRRIDIAFGVTPGPALIARHAISGPVMFQDDLVFAVRPASHIMSIAALDRRTLCFIDGTTLGDLALESMERRGIHPIPFPFQEQGEMDAAVAGGRCDAVAGSASRLAGFTRQFGRLHILQPPFGMVPATVATRQEDAAWTSDVAQAVGAALACGAPTRPPAPSPCR